MANTYTQLTTHVVFAVRGRQNLIPAQHKDELYKYIAGVIRNHRQKLLAIGGMPDHLHFLIGQTPDVKLSDLVKTIKVASNLFVNEKHWFRGKFSWQEGFGAFSYSRSQRDPVIHYIVHQEEHHKRRSFRDEYEQLLKDFEVEYDTRYVFEFI